tara:strand:- start:692 stop:871 length:180 start_codon:yes stop_codon:yes gene_type:complete
LAVALAKSVGEAAILHNSSYNDDFFSFKNINAKNCAKRTYNFYYVHFAWDGFYGEFFVF